MSHNPWLWGIGNTNVYTDRNEYFGNITFSKKAKNPQD